MTRIHDKYFGDYFAAFVRGKNHYLIFKGDSMREVKSRINRFNATYNLNAVANFSNINAKAISHLEEIASDYSSSNTYVTKRQIKNILAS